MIEKPQTFRALIDHLGGVTKFSQITGIGAFSAKKMRDRNSIAVEHWTGVISAAKAEGLILTSDDLVNMKLRATKPEASKSRDGARPKKMAANPKVAAGAI
jgi:hypothetical protein